MSGGAIDHQHVLLAFSLHTTVPFSVGGNAQEGERGEGEGGVWKGRGVGDCGIPVQFQLLLLLSWCLMSSDVIWHIRDKLWPMPKHGSIRKVYACLAVTCHLHFWQNDRDFLRAIVVTRGWNGYRNKSQHRKSTLEKKILPPFQQGFEPATFQSRVRRSNHWAIPAPEIQFQFLIFGFIVCYLFTLSLFPCTLFVFFFLS